MGFEEGRPRRRAGRARRAGGLGAATAYNRGQVLYRVAELMEARRGQFVDDVRAATGATRRAAAAEVDAAVDRWVWYAGWSDKLAQIAGSSNPVAGPYFNFSVPEPSGVIGVVAPVDSALLGLVRWSHRRSPPATPWSWSPTSAGPCQP